MGTALTREGDLDLLGGGGHSRAMFPEVELTRELGLAAGIVVLGGLMRGFTGFGSAMTFAPLLSLMWGPVAAVGTIILLETAVTVQLVPGALKEARLRDIGPLTAAACAAVPLGGYVLVSVDPDLMRRAISGVVLAFVLVMLRGWRYRGARHPLSSAGVGLVSGALMGATSVGGPPVILYLLSGPDAAARNRANIIVYFALGSAMVLLVFLLNGVIGLQSAWRALLLAPFFILAAYAGSRLFRRSSEALYRRIALYVLLGVALAGLLA